MLNEQQREFLEESACDGRVWVDDCGILHYEASWLQRARQLFDDLWELQDIIEANIVLVADENDDEEECICWGGIIKELSK